MKEKIKHAGICNVTNCREDIEFTVVINRCAAGNIVMDICGLNNCSVKNSGGISNVCEECNILNGIIESVSTKLEIM